MRCKMGRMRAVSTRNPTQSPLALTFPFYGSNFRITYDENLTIGCSAFRLDSSTGKQGHTQIYDSSKLPLLNWAVDVIKESSSCS